MGVSGDDMDASLTDSEAIAMTSHAKRSATMGVKINYFAALLAVGAAAGVIAVAPSATAAPNQNSAGASSIAATSDQTEAHQACMSLGGTQSECQSPGNAQIYDAPPQVDYFPYAGGGT
jgi:hypothetical protein